MKKDYRKLIMILFNALIIIANAIIYWRVWVYFYKFNIVAPFYEKGTILLVLLYTIILTTLTSLYGGYNVGFNRITELIYSHILAFIFTNIITYIQISLIAREMVDATPILLMTTVQLVVVIVWSYIGNRMYFSLHPPLKTMVIYSGGNITDFLEKLKTREDRYSVSEIYNINGGADDVFRLIQEKSIEAIFICDIESQSRKELIKYCFYNSIRVFTLPSLTDILTKSSELFHIFDTPLFAFKNAEIPLEEALFKRVLDIVLSSVLIVLSFPIMIIIAISIMLEDGGPIIFKQDRLTKDNEVFKIMKFRSMIKDAEDDGIARLASNEDNRITKVGKFIRKIRFDEIPQFVNVLKGEMSLVGPRPERPEIAEEYIKNVPEFKYRTRVKAGLTGYAQLMGKYDTKPEDKLKLDLYYIGNYSIIQDFILIIMTLRRLISRT